MLKLDLCLGLKCCDYIQFKGENNETFYSNLKVEVGVGREKKMVIDLFTYWGKVIRMKKLSVSQMPGEKNYQKKKIIFLLIHQPNMPSLCLNVQFYVVLNAKLETLQCN